MKRHSYVKTSLALACILGLMLSMGQAQPAHSESACALAGECPPVQGTPGFTIVYGTVKAGGTDAEVGTVVEARSPRGDTVGCFVVDTAGHYGAMYIYGEDTSASPTIPGMRASEQVAFYVDGVPALASPALLWQDDKELHEVSLSAPRKGTRSDIDGDGKTDLVIYRPGFSAWFALKSSTGYDTGSPFGMAWGVEGDIPLGGDLDGDAKMDLIVYRPAYGVWFGLLSSTDYDPASYFVQGWGIPGDQPLSGDVDGDGKMDLVIYRPSAGVWFVLESSTNYSTVFARAWGMEGDIPVSGDLDGDGKMDLIVYRPAYGVWFGLLSSADYDPASYFVQGWGIPGDQPLSGDVDGDGKMDLVIYRPSYGVWFALLSASDYTTTFGKAWGVAGDIPVSGDLDGDGKMDLIVYRPTYGVWFGLTSSTNYDYGAYFVKGWGGMSGDTPNP